MQPIINKLFDRTVDEITFRNPVSYGLNFTGGASVEISGLGLAELDHYGTGIYYAVAGNNWEIQISVGEWYEILTAAIVTAKGTI